MKYVKKSGHGEEWVNLKRFSFLFEKQACTLVQE
jgi:hypothetical protein